MTLKAQLKDYHLQVSKRLLHFQLKNKNFTIVSNNCWGGEVYKEFGLPYQTPFVGLFLFPPCYIKLLKNPRHYLEEKLVFTHHSHYSLANKSRRQGVWDSYPIAQLGDTIEIHFMHYSSDREAQEKWLRRTQRINWENQDSLFFKFCDHGGCETSLLNEFDALPYRHKVCFTGQKYPDLKSAIWIKECNDEGYVRDGRKLYQDCKHYFDVIGWLNGGNGHLTFAQKRLNQLFYEKLS